MNNACATIPALAAVGSAWNCTTPYGRSRPNAGGAIIGINYRFARPATGARTAFMGLAAKPFGRRSTASTTPKLPKVCGPKVRGSNVADKYRPSSGTEGADFMSNWCYRCERDRDYRDNDGDSCPIAAAALCYELSDPEYPDAWRYERGEPVCTAFDATDPMDVPHMNAAALADLFPGLRQRLTQGQQIRALVTGEAGNA